MKAARGPTRPYRGHRESERGTKAHLFGTEKVCSYVTCDGIPHKHLPNVDWKDKRFGQAARLRPC